jgi:hypothetical protein
MIFEIDNKTRMIEDEWDTLEGTIKNIIILSHPLTSKEVESRYNSEKRNE